jgi:hypothetical protein
MLMMFLFRLITNILNLLLVASMSESMCSLHIIQLVLMHPLDYYWIVWDLKISNFIFKGA